MNGSIMAHLVAFYPNREACLEAARGLVDGGCAYLEVQFPFSDPTADGPDIQKACRDALAAGFTVEEGFRLLGELRKTIPVPIFLMSYANLVFTRGVERFLLACREVGVRGLIVPDLPPDFDEGLYTMAPRLGLAAVPVVFPTVRPERLARVLELGTEYLYTALRKGITGAYTEIGQENLAFLRLISALARKRPPKILAGFGVSGRDQVESLAPHVHAVVVGSALVQAIGSSADPYQAAAETMRGLTGLTSQKFSGTRKHEGKSY